jgi:hypothetical protein
LSSLDSLSTDRHKLVYLRTLISTPGMFSHKACSFSYACFIFCVSIKSNSY